MSSKPTSSKRRKRLYHAEQSVWSSSGWLFWEIGDEGGEIVTESIMVALRRFATSPYIGLDPLTELVREAVRCAVNRIIPEAIDHYLNGNGGDDGATIVPLLVLRDDGQIWLEITGPEYRQKSGAHAVLMGREVLFEELLRESLGCMVDDARDLRDPVLRAAASRLRKTADELEAAVTK